MYVDLPPLRVASRVMTLFLSLLIYNLHGGFTSSLEDDLGRCLVDGHNRFIIKYSFGTRGDIDLDPLIVREASVLERMREVLSLSLSF